MAVEEAMDPYDSAVILKQRPSGDSKRVLRRQISGRKSYRNSFITTVDDRGWSLLHVAAKAGNLEEVLLGIRGKLSCIQSAHVQTWSDWMGLEGQPEFLPSLMSVTTFPIAAFLAVVDIE